MSEPEKEKEEEDKDLSPLSPAVRIFLVEDNPDHVFIALTVVRQVLGDDIELVHASNADEALLMIAQFTEQDRPDLFLVDLRLPDNGGFSVLQAARANEALTAVPMFVITSSLTIATLPRAISSAPPPFCASRCRAPSCATSWYAWERCRSRSARATRRIATDHIPIA